MDRKENKLILELKEKLNSPWLFLGQNKESRVVEVDKELILDEEIDFINIISDFYTVEALHKNVGGYSEESIDNKIIRKVTACHGEILRLKLFYQNELSNIIENNKSLDDKLKKIFENFSEKSFFSWKYRKRLLLSTMDLRQINLLTKNLHIELYKETKKRESDVIDQLTENQKLMLRLYSLNYIYAALFEDLELQNSILFSCDSWEDLTETSGKILNILDEYQQKCEPIVFCLNKAELDRIGRVLDIYEMAERYDKAIKDLNIDNFEKDRIKCYASVIKDNIIYMTLNGVRDENIKVNGAGNSNLQKVVNILAELLGRDVEYVSITPDTRYYVNPDLYIDYSQYKDSKENLNRMFTCCERKLIAKMFSPECRDEGKIKLLISKYPCVICSRTIEIVNKVKKKIEIIDPLEEDEELNPCLIARMDECAKTIDVQHPRN